MPDSAGSDLLRRLVVECLERLEEEGPAAVDELCRRHPEQSDALRRRLAILGSAGLIGRGANAGDLPERLGDFRLIARLGGGGMGVVFEAEQMSLRRTVALKLVRPELLFFPGSRERFQREIAAIARVAHPGIVPIHAVGEEGGIPYFAMERVHGLTLAELLEALGGRDPAKLRGEDLRAALAVRLKQDVAPFPESFEASVASLVRQAAEALEHCHRRGVLHRDVKPSNLMLGADGRVQLFDFGVASADGAERLTLSGAHLGSPLYMSPEQLRGEHSELDARTDVYSLGVTFYELLTLQHPYHGATTQETARRVLDGTPPPPRSHNRALSRDAEAVCQKAMDVERRHRYASAGDLVHDLGELVARRPVAARPPTAARRARRWVARHPAASVALATAIAVPLGFAWQERAGRLEVDRERKLAQESLNAALEAIDNVLVRVGDGTLADVPQMERVRALVLADASALLERLEARHSDDPAVQRLAARARWRAGALAALLGRSDEAEASFLAAEERLCAFPDAALDLATVRLERGELLAADPARAADALAALESARAGLLALPEDATTLSTLSSAHSNIAVVEAQLGRREEALAACEAAVDAARRALDASAGETGARLQLATALATLAKVRQGSGDAERGVAELEESIELLSELSQERPEVADWRLRLGLARSTLGFLLDAAGEAENARDQVLLARDDLASLVQDFPSVPRYRLELAGMLQALGVLERDPREAERLVREALALTEAVAAESPAQLDLLGNLSAGYANLALKLANEERIPEARDALEKSAGARRRLAAANRSDPLVARLLDHQVRTVEMLLALETNEVDGKLDALARDLAREASEANLRDAAALAADARWSRALAADDPAEE